MQSRHEDPVQTGLCGTSFISSAFFLTSPQPQYPSPSVTSSSLNKLGICTMDEDKGAHVLTAQEVSVAQTQTEHDAHDMARLGKKQVFKVSRVKTFIAKCSLRLFSASAHC